MRTILFLLKNLGPFKARFSTIFCVAILDGATLFFIPATLSELTRDVGNLSLDTAWSGFAFISGLYIVSLFLQYVIRAHGEPLGHQYGNYLRERYYAELAEIPLHRLQTNHSGYLLSLVNRVGDSMHTTFLSSFWVFGSGIAAFSLFFAFLVRESLWLALLNGVVFLCFLALSLLLSRRMVPLSQDFNRKQASLIEQLSDFLSNIVTVKKLNLHSFSRTQLSHRLSASTHSIQAQALFHGRRWFVLHLLFGCAFVVTLGMLLVRIGSGASTASVLVLFIAAYSRIRGLVEQFSEAFLSFFALGAYIGDLEAIIGSKSKQERTHVKPDWTSIEVDSVEFTHETSGRTIRAPHFALARGDAVAVIGPSGGGKSTLLNLISGLLQPQSGAIRCRLQDGTVCPVSELLPWVAFVSQEVELFNLSLRDNLTLGQALSDEALYEHLEGVSLRSWVAELPAGLDTIVGEKGVILSAGQKQRLNLVRGLLLPCEVLLLDEPTSHLDEATEGQVVKFLKERLIGRSTVIVTHRPALKELCNKLYSMTGDGELRHLSEVS